MDAHRAARLTAWGMVAYVKAVKLGLVAHQRPFSIVLADAHMGYRSGVARAIAAHRALALIGVAGEGANALRLIERRRPDVALVDVRLPGLGGLLISRRLADREPQLSTRIVIASTLLDRPAGLLQQAMSVGAVGWLSKDASREEICEALIAAARGGTWASSDPAIGMICFPEERQANAPRRREVARGVLET
jgi:DNA-binding NarL/FixJ family response regulator